MKTFLEAIEAKSTESRQSAVVGIGTPSHPQASVPVSLILAVNNSVALVTLF
jgi:hypothetical protein